LVESLERSILAELLKVIVIGSGKVAGHFGRAIVGNGLELGGIWARNLEKRSALAHALNCAEYTGLTDLPLDADIYLLAIKDDAIADVVEQMPKVNGIVCHCSGTLPIAALGQQKYAGVIWPLQSFSEGTDVDFQTIPLLLESSDEESFRIMEAFADRLSKKVIRVNQGLRQHMHLAAVMVNNFPNLLYTLAADFLAKNNLAFNLFHALLQEGVQKLTHLAPEHAQTGPALRNDEKTIAAHVKLLENEAQLAEIYSLFTRLIQERFKK